MSFEAISWACRQTVGKSSIKFVLIALANHADAQGFAWPSITSICQTTEQDRKTVISAIDALCKTGLLIDTGDKKGNTKQVPMYRLALSEADANSTVKPSQKRNSSKNGTVPKNTGNSTVLPHKQSQKRDTEPSGTIKNRQLIVSRPDGVDEKLWRDFIALRDKKKAPLSETAWAGIVRESEKAGMSLSEVLATCCERGWQAFKAEWVADKKTGTVLRFDPRAQAEQRAGALGLSARPGESWDEFSRRVSASAGAHA